ncbi:MAG: M14 family metallopeptidase [Lysobacterales bacterium]
MKPLDLSCFCSDYEAACQRFCKDADDAGCTLRNFLLPANRNLGLNVARFGPKETSRVLFILSGVHGVEGLCGSGCQVDWLRSGYAAEIPPDMAVVLLHFVNPWGGARTCVENENNVDLNRNFLDHTRPYPVNPLYRELHAAFTCPEYEGPLRDAAEQEIRDFIFQYGFDAFLDAAARGQYDHKKGFNFGGNSEQWSNRVVRHVFAEESAHAKRVAVVDIHTGLGPYGEGMVIFDGSPGSEAEKRARSWYGSDIACNDSGEIGYKTTGGLVEGCASEFPRSEYTGIVLEYGTREIERVAGAMRYSFWLQHFGDFDSELGLKIRNELLDAFYVDADDWKEMVLKRARDVLAQAITGLAGST